MLGVCVCVCNFRGPFYEIVKCVYVYVVQLSRFFSADVEQIVAFAEMRNICKFS